MQFFKSVIVLAIATMATAEKTVTVYECGPSPTAIIPTGAYPMTSGHAAPTGYPASPVVPVVGSTGIITPPAPTTSPIYSGASAAGGASFGAIVLAAGAALLL